jgi:BlaI family transcriptional regulator, penicillinase repressor
MPRPKMLHPTPAELEILKILWDSGPLTVRDVMEELQERDKDRAYTSVMSLLNVMADKKLLSRSRQGRAFLYAAKLPREKALSGMVGDLWQRAFDGSTSSLVMHLLSQASPSEEELAAIRQAIAAYESDREDKS